MTLYAATSNPGKLREFAECAATANLDVLPLPHLATVPEPLEDASTFMGNAELKALAYSRLAPGLLVFADDSGLEVEALGGQPGVRSARFAEDLAFEPDAGLPELAKLPKLGKDERNNRCVLSLLQRLAIASERPVSRKASFRCALALARDGHLLLRAEGTCEGEILEAPQGKAGFGYDPLFFLPGLGGSMAELDRKEKWSLSHRGNAFRNLLEQLRTRPLP